MNSPHTQWLYNGEGWEVEETLERWTAEGEEVYHNWYLKTQAPFYNRELHAQRPFLQALRARPGGFEILSRPANASMHRE